MLNKPRSIWWMTKDIVSTVLHNNLYIFNLFGRDVTF